MTSVSLNQFLVLYAWFPLAALLLFMMLIARFYEQFSGQRTFFRFFPIPVVLFGAAAVRYASINQTHDDQIGAVLMAAAGLLLIALSGNLYRVMLKKEKGPH